MILLPNWDVYILVDEWVWPQLRWPLSASCSQAALTVNRKEFWRSDLLQYSTPRSFESQTLLSMTQESGTLIMHLRIGSIAIWYTSWLLRRKSLSQRKACLVRQLFFSNYQYNEHHQELETLTLKVIRFLHRWGICINPIWYHISKGVLMLVSRDRGDSDK